METPLVSRPDGRLNPLSQKFCSLRGIYTGDFMQLQLSAAPLAVAFALPAHAVTEVQWWHSMGGALGEWVNDLAKDFNASQKDYKIVPTFKGTYDESMTAAIAAFRAGNAP